MPLNYYTFWSYWKKVRTWRVELEWLDFTWVPMQSLYNNTLLLILLEMKEIDFSVSITYRDDIMRVRNVNRFEQSLSLICLRLDVWRSEIESIYISSFDIGEGWALKSYLIHLSLLIFSFWYRMNKAFSLVIKYLKLLSWLIISGDSFFIYLSELNFAAAFELINIDKFGLNWRPFS